MASPKVFLADSNSRKWLAKREERIRSIRQFVRQYIQYMQVG